MAKPNHLSICLAVLVSRKRVDPFEGEFKDGASIKQVVEILTVLPYLPLACWNPLLHNCNHTPRNFKDTGLVSSERIKDYLFLGLSNSVIRIVLTDPLQ